MTRADRIEAALLRWIAALAVVNFWAWVLT